MLYLSEGTLRRCKGTFPRVCSLECVRVERGEKSITLGAAN